MSTKPWNLEPLDLGGILDTSVRIWRAYFKPLFLIGLGLGLIGFAITKGVAIFATPISALAAMKDPNEILAAFARSGPALAGIFGLTLLSAWVAWLGAVCGAAFIVPSILGEPISIGGAVGRAIQRASTATWAAVLMVLWCLGAGLAVGIPFVIVFAIATALHGWASVLLMIAFLILWTIACVGVVLWLWIRFLLLTTVLAAEKASGFQSLLRSGRLVSGRVGPGFFGLVHVRAGVLVTVVLLILGITGLLAVLPTEIVGIATSGHLQTTAQAALSAHPWMIFAQLCGVGIRAVFSPLLWVFAAVFYLDMRSRREGLDLQRQLDSDVAA